MNWYIITNVVAALMIFTIFIISLWLEGWTFKKIQIKQITIVAMFVAVSATLTNAIGYTLPILPGGIKLALGDWLIFVVGALFGPLLGFIAGSTTDTIGSLIQLGGVYHCGFMFEKVLLGFMGSMVFLFKHKKYLVLKLSLMYTLVYTLITLLLNPIWLYASGWSNAVFVGMVIKLIKLPISLFIYITFINTSFLLCYKLLSYNSESLLWCNRKVIMYDKLEKEELSGYNKSSEVI